MNQEITAPIHLHDTAEKIMTRAVPMIHHDATIEQIEKLLLQKTNDFSSIDYIYIINTHNILKGIVSIKELFRAHKLTLVEEIMSTEIISVRPHTDQERVALLAVKHNLKSIPVVDKDGHFLGIVPSDVILNVLNNEAIENILRLGGVLNHATNGDILHTPIIKSLQYRLPWLILGLIGGIFTSSIISSFENILAAHLILATFIPLIVYMADAVGTQMEAFIIRDLALEPNIKFIPYFFRHLLVVILIGVIISGILFFFNTFFFHDMRIALVISIALLFSVMSSVITGLSIPYVFHKLSLDPANASGPIATILQDMFSVLVYFLIASSLL